MTRWSLPLAALALALPAPAMAQPANPGGWSGFYIGLDVGLASGKLRASGSDFVQQVTNINPPGPQPLTVVPGYFQNFSGSDRQSGLLYGATAGFMVRTGNWLLGIEADGHGSRNAGAYSATFAKPPTILEPAGTVSVIRDANISWDWSARGRIGHIWGPSMIYAAGGVASAHVRLRGEDTYLVPAGTAAPNGNGGVVSPTIGPVTIANSGRGTLTGWTAGVGGERRVSRHVSIGLDARYTDYGSRAIVLPDCFVNSISQNQCAGATVISGGTITFPAGTAPATISPSGNDAYPFITPDDTRVSLNEIRVSARLIFRF